MRAKPGYIPGGCNNKLRPLPQPARHPLVELVDGVLVVCGDLRECWTYSQGNDSWLPTWSLGEERRRASSVSLGGDLFVTGGYLPGSLVHLHVEDTSEELLRQLPRAIKTQLWDEISLGGISCLSLCLYGIRAPYNAMRVVRSLPEILDGVWAG